MNYRLSCEQVNALMNFYLEDSLSDILSKYMKEHLDTCPECNAKYLQYKNLLNNSVNLSDDINEKLPELQLYESFKSDLSAYVDNELDNRQNIKIKKLTISNPLARRELEDMYSYKNLLNNSFEKTKNTFKSDFSNDVICKVKNKCKKTWFTFQNILAIFFVLLCFLIFGLVLFLYL